MDVEAMDVEATDVEGGTFIEPGGGRRIPELPEPDLDVFGFPDDFFYRYVSILHQIKRSKQTHRDIQVNFDGLAFLKLQI